MEAYQAQVQLLRLSKSKILPIVEVYTSIIYILNTRNSLVDKVFLEVGRTFINIDGVYCTR